MSCRNEVTEVQLILEQDLVLALLTQHSFQLLSSKGLFSGPGLMLLRSTAFVFGWVLMRGRITGCRHGLRH